jgi:hypothetical protein
MATDIRSGGTGRTSSTFQRPEAAAACSGESTWKLVPPGARLVTP